MTDIYLDAHETYLYVHIHLHVHNINLNLSDILIYTCLYTCITHSCMCIYIYAKYMPHTSIHKSIYDKIP